MDVSYWFPFVKLMHIGGLVLWLGPSGGAWLLLQLVKRRMDQQSLEYRELYRDFLKFFWIEHFGLLLLIGSGILMLFVYGHTALEWDWLKWKLALVFYVIIPIEILDMWFGHVRLPRFDSSGAQTNAAASKLDAHDLYERRQRISRPQRNKRSVGEAGIFRGTLPQPDFWHRVHSLRMQAAVA